VGFVFGSGIPSGPGASAGLRYASVWAAPGHWVLAGGPVFGWIRSRSRHAQSGYDNVLNQAGIALADRLAWKAVFTYVLKKFGRDPDEFLDDRPVIAANARIGSSMYLVPSGGDWLHLIARVIEVISYAVSAAARYLPGFSVANAENEDEFGQPIAYRPPDKC